MFHTRIASSLLLSSLLLIACSAQPGGDTAGSSSASSSAQLQADITVSEPQPNESMSSPLTVRGEASGTWYFEASFPVKLLDANGNQIAVAPAQAQGDWMTTALVPFEAELTFTVTTPQTGTLILEKDNPSGDPQNGAMISIPIQLVP